MIIYHTTDCVYEIQLQARGLGKTYAEEKFNKLKDVYKGGFTHAKKLDAYRPARPDYIDHR